MRMFGLKSILLAAGLAVAGVGHAAPQSAQPAAPAATTATTQAATPAPAASATPTPADPTLSADGKQLVAPTAGIGQPVDGAIGLQPQVTATGIEAHHFYTYILVPLISAISLFVLALLLWVIYRYRAGKNPIPSRTSHNTTIEVIWTLVPVLILVFIAVPSMKLLANQYAPAPKTAVTLKAIGNQWFWSYEYPDNGDIQFVSNMLKEKNEVQPGERYRTDADGPRLLAVDNRVVLPINTPIRLETTANDVIHSWAVPAFWIKLDAIPGRLNETSFVIDKPGLYFGQCSELCGTNHGFMPIAVEAVSPAEFAAWVHAKGGTMPNDKKAGAGEMGPTQDQAVTPAGVVPPAGDTTSGTLNGNAVSNQTSNPAVSN